MLDISTYVYSVSCPYCGKRLDVRKDLISSTLGKNTVYTVSCDCASGCSSHFRLDLGYNIRSKFSCNDDFNILIAYIDYFEERDEKIYNERFK